MQEAFRAPACSAASGIEARVFGEIPRFVLRIVYRHCRADAGLVEIAHDQHVGCLLLFLLLLMAADLGTFG